MKAVVIKGHGDIDQVAIEEVDTPRPKTNEVLVNVKAAALNHLDLFVIQGLPGLELTMPHILGADGSGVVTQVGEGVKNFRRGDAVMINPGISCDVCEFCEMGEQSLCPKFGILGEHFPGTFAEYVAVPEKNLAYLPRTSSYEDAAAFTLAFLTAWRMLITKAAIKPSETILIHGIGGGVATACMQIALHASLRVIVTSSSIDKLERAKGYGSHYEINYNKEDIYQRIRHITGKRGVDIVVDSVGEKTWNNTIRCVRKGGRIVTCGATTGPGPIEDLSRIFWNQISIMGSTMGSRSDFRGVVRFHESKKVRPIIQKIYGFEDAQKALSDLKKQKQFGKLVLAMP